MTEDSIKRWRENVLSGSENTKSLVYRGSVTCLHSFLWGPEGCTHCVSLGQDQIGARRFQSQLGEFLLIITRVSVIKILSPPFPSYFKYRTHICLIFLWFLKKYVLCVPAHFYFSHFNLKFIGNMKYEKIFPLTCSLGWGEERGQVVKNTCSGREACSAGHFISGTRHDSSMLLPGCYMGPVCQGGQKRGPSSFQFPECRPLSISLSRSGAFVWRQ